MPGSPEGMRRMPQPTSETTPSQLPSSQPEQLTGPSLTVVEGGNPTMPTTTAEQRATAGPELQVVQGGTADLSQPQSVLDRASRLLGGTPIALDAASYTQRILKSVEGKSTAEIQDLAQRYTRSTHPAEGVPMPSAEMLQELAMTAAILEAKVAADQAAAAAKLVETTAPTVSAEEAPTTLIEGRDTDMVAQWQERRVQLLNDVLGLTAAATMADAEKIANALGSEKAEDALAELRAIDARLNGAVGSAPRAAETATPQPVVEPTPVVVESVEEDTAEAATEKVNRVDESVGTENNQAEESGLTMERIRNTIESDISGLEKTLRMYRQYEADLAKQYSGMDKFFARLGLSSEKKRKGVERLRHIQVAIAHVEESVANLNTQLVELQIADTAFQELVDEAIAEQRLESEKEQDGIVDMMQEESREQKSE